MVGTKTSGDDEISVPPELIAVFRWQVDMQLRPGPKRSPSCCSPRR